MCSPSPAMVSSPYEWKIPEWDDKLQTKKNIVVIVNKQTLRQMCSLVTSIGKEDKSFDLIDNTERGNF